MGFVRYVLQCYKGLLNLLLPGTRGRLDGQVDTVSRTMLEVKKLNDNVFEFCNSDKPVAELIFFHGFQLGNDTSQVQCRHLTTWTKKSFPTEYWPQTLFDKDGLKIRALTVRYDANKERTPTTGRLDLYLIAENFVYTIIDNDIINVGQTDGVPVILVGHCFGGLVIKEFIDKAAGIARSGDTRINRRIENFLDNLGGVFYYSTPHLALRKKVVDKLFPGEGHIHYSPLVPNFQTLNKDVARLHSKMSDNCWIHGRRYGGISTMEVFEGQVTDLGFWKGMIIEEGSGRGGADKTSVINEDHINICRPDDVTSNNFQMLADFIRDVCANFKA